MHPVQCLPLTGPPEAVPEFSLQSPYPSLT